MERPILFSGPMVRAILDGKKTQTRRIVKPQPDEMSAKNYYLGDWVAKSPFGRAGDRLWVRETFYCDLERGSEAELRENLYYRADGDCCDQIPECSCVEVGKPRWRPSIHMPRWASRITLEIIGVRVERLNEISMADMGREGAPEHRSYDQWFSELWETINGVGSWDANPWVWVIEFKKLEAKNG